jgi:signal transduction histidine kinase
LRPGRYEFLVRARNGPDQPPGPPAAFSFTVPAPFYRSWWFLTLGASMLAGLTFAFQQTRIQRLRAIAALRDRIAQDLHDDIGTSLTKIAVLSEVARARGAGGPQLAEISRAAQAAVDSLGSAVWAISSANDNLKGLIRATRKLTADLFGNDDAITAVTGPDEDVALPQDLRRQVFSMVNETLNNAARHSGCSEVHVAFAIEKDILRIEIRDDGRGFSPDRIEGGHGLRGLRQRSQLLGGSVEIASRPGEGTRVQFALPVR